MQIKKLVKQHLTKTKQISPTEIKTNLIYYYNLKLFIIYYYEVYEVVHI